MGNDEALRYLAKRRTDAKRHLGGVCVRCGTEMALEFDHRDPATKVITIASAIALHWSWERLLVELDKCQLLCRPCHRDKSRAAGELGGGHNRVVAPQHGTAVMYGAPHRCRCDECREWKSLYRSRLVDARGRTLAP